MEEVRESFVTSDSVEAIGARASALHAHAQSPEEFGAIYEALLETALALFGERGCEAVSVEEIVARAGSSVGTFYAYFRSKQQILLVLLQQYLDVMHSLNLLSFDLGRAPLETIMGIIQKAIEPDRAYAVGKVEEQFYTLPSNLLYIMYKM